MVCSTIVLGRLVPPVESQSRIDNLLHVGPSLQLIVARSVQFWGFGFQAPGVHTCRRVSWHGRFYDVVVS